MKLNQFVKFFLLCSIFALFAEHFLIQRAWAEEENEDDIEWLDDEDDLESELSEEESESKKSGQKKASSAEAKKDSLNGSALESAENKDGSESEDTLESKDSPDSEDPSALESAENKDTLDTPSANTDEPVSAENAETDISSPDTDLNDQQDTAFETDQYEQSLYEIYTQYHSGKVDINKWLEISQSAPDIYTIQKKDTLWDISKLLFNDSHYWPKLWSLNPTLGNPHLIQPGFSLSFTPGTEGSAPYLTLNKSKTLPEFLKGEKIQLPAGEKKAPLMKTLPSSLRPLHLHVAKKDKPPKLNIITQSTNISTKAFLRFYMSAEPLSGIGVISGPEDYGSLFHVGQNVLLEMHEPVNPGQKLLVVNDKGKLYSPVLGVRGPFGRQIEVQGVVEVIGRVSDSFDLYTAKIIRSLNPIFVGAIVIPQSITNFDYQPTGIFGSSSAQIIGMPSIFTASAKNIASPYSLVYLNRGVASGLNVGQMYHIKANPDISIRKRKYLYDVKLAELKIIHANNRFSTGLITQMNNPVYVGDYITPPNTDISTQKGYDPLDEEFDDSGDKSLLAPGVTDSFESEQAGYSEDLDREPPVTEGDPVIDEDEEDVFEAFE